MTHAAKFVHFVPETDLLEQNCWKMKFDKQSGHMFAVFSALQCVSCANFGLGKKLDTYNFWYYQMENEEQCTAMCRIQNTI